MYNYIYKTFYIFILIKKNILYISIFVFLNYFNILNYFNFQINFILIMILISPLTVLEPVNHLVPPYECHNILYSILRIHLNHQPIIINEISFICPQVFFPYLLFI